MQRKDIIIMQRDMTMLLDRNSSVASEARLAITPFTELLKVLGQFEVYECTALTIWNALTLGIKSERILQIIGTYCRGGLSSASGDQIKLWISRFGKLKLQLIGQELMLSGDSIVMQELAQKKLADSWIEERRNDHTWLIKREGRGFLKQELARAGYAVQDEVGYREGENLAIELLPTTNNGHSFQLRDYQRKAIAAFHRDVIGGSGVIVLPCGTGKTVTGIGVLASLQTEALIVTSSVTSARQWKAELLDKTTISEQEIGMYCGRERKVGKVTIATYTILTHRSSKSLQYVHMKLFSERNWGLIIYDEVQLLPAPIFRMTAMLQATRRLGLTATLIREDGCAGDVFSLVGPKLYDMNWKQAESESYIAKVVCTEVRIPLLQEDQQLYTDATPRSRLKIAAQNQNKLTAVVAILKQHRDKPTLIIGQYIHQLQHIAAELGLPLITGSTSYEQREQIFAAFRSGKIKTLVVSKIANLAVDLPDACVAIQVSGSFGSRQEEAQRIGRLLRPKKGSNEAWFYTLVTEQSKETEFALKRGMFMLEQGYQYRCVSQAEVMI